MSLMHVVDLARKRDTQGLECFLKLKKSELDFLNQKCLIEGVYYTPVTYLLANAEIEAAAFLIKYGASLDDAAYFVAKSGCFETIKALSEYCPLPVKPALLGAGAGGQSEVIWRIRYFYPDEAPEEFRGAAEYGHFEVLDEMLEAHAEQPNYLRMQSICKGIAANRQYSGAEKMDLTHHYLSQPLSFPDDYSAEQQDEFKQQLILNQLEIAVIEEDESFMDALLTRYPNLKPRVIQLADAHEQWPLLLKALLTFQFAKDDHAHIEATKQAKLPELLGHVARQRDFLCGKLVMRHAPELIRELLTQSIVEKSVSLIAYILLSYPSLDHFGLVLGQLPKQDPAYQKFQQASALARRSKVGLMMLVTLLAVIAAIGLSALCFMVPMLVLPGAMMAGVFTLLALCAVAYIVKSRWDRENAMDMLRGYCPQVLLNPEAVIYEKPVLAETECRIPLSEMSFFNNREAEAAEVAAEFAPSWAKI